MATAAVIAAEHLTKSYGAQRGVIDLTFDVAPGEVFGFLGPNGAGKTTTIRTALDLLRPTDGRITLFGLDPRSDGPAIRSRIGFLPGELALWPRMTAGDYLRAFGAFRGGVDPRSIDAYAERLSLDLSRRIRALSHGNKQKIGLVLAFAHEPELLILDEPTQGLDPLIQQEFYSMVEEAKARGATVFLSSHVMPEVERICDRVAIIRDGLLVRVADIADLKEQAVRMIELHFDRPVSPAAFASLGSVRAVEPHGDALRLTVQGAADEVIKEAARHTVISVSSDEPSLEDIFLTIYRDDREDRRDGLGGDE